MGLDEIKKLPDLSGRVVIPLRKVTDLKRRQLVEFSGTTDSSVFFQRVGYVAGVGNVNSHPSLLYSGQIGENFDLEDVGFMPLAYLQSYTVLRQYDVRGQ